MADIAKLRTFVETMATAVRAGLLTPSADDEKFVREYFGLPPMNESVLADWVKTEGARSPITISAAEADKREAQKIQQEQNNGNTDQKN